MTAPPSWLGESGQKLAQEILSTGAPLWREATTFAKRAAASPTGQALIAWGTPHLPKSLGAPPAPFWQPLLAWAALAALAGALGTGAFGLSMAAFAAMLTILILQHVFGIEFDGMPSA